MLAFASTPNHLSTPQLCPLAVPHATACPRHPRCLQLTCAISFPLLLVQDSGPVLCVTGQQCLVCQRELARPGWQWDGKLWCSPSLGEAEEPMAVPRRRWRLCRRHYLGVEAELKKAERCRFPRGTVHTLQLTLEAVLENWAADFMKGVEASPASAEPTHRPSVHSRPSLPLANTHKQPAASNTLKPANGSPRAPAVCALQLS